MFQGSLLEPNLDFNVVPGFMNTPENFGSNMLVGVVTAGVKSGFSSEVVLDESSFADITASVINGTLARRAPSQYTDYTLFAFYQRYTNQRSCTSSSNAQTVIGNGSWIVDHFSGAGAQRITDFWDHELLDDTTKDLRRATEEYSWQDSMEMQAATFWTNEFVERFTFYRGYSPNKYLPLYFSVANQWSSIQSPYNTTYVLDSQAAQEKYLQDYRLTLDEGYKSFLAHYQSWANSLGLNHTAQVAYNLPFDMPGSVPIVGAPELESLGFPTIDNALHFVGAAHLSGRNVISTEVGALPLKSYTQTIPALINLFKESFAAGVNMMVTHGYAYNGEYFGTTWTGYDPLGYRFTDVWNDRQPAWRHMNDTMAYTARNSLVLQTGVPKVDLAFYFYEQPWKEIDSYSGDDLRATGFKHEYLGSTNLESADAFIQDGTLAPDGPEYRALIHCNQTFISPAASAKLLDYATEGLPIFIIGNIPHITIGNSGQKEVSSNMRALVKTHSNIHVLKNGNSLVSALQIAGVRPRASLLDGTGSGSLYKSWRSDTTSNVEFVYLYNKGSDASFRLAFGTAQDAVPYLLDAWTGQQSPLLVYNASQGHLTTTVSLKENQTKTIAFSSEGRRTNVHAISHSENIEKFQLNPDGNIEALLKEGKANVLMSNGDRKVVIGRRNSTIDPPEITVGPWSLTIESYGPLSNASSVNTKIVSIDAGEFPLLLPWTNITGLESISRIGIYSASFTLPESYSENNMAAIITLGPVLNTLRAWVNGNLLPSVDISDPESDISRWVVSGENHIKIEVSSTLFNAVKMHIDTVNSTGRGPMDPKSYTETENASFGLLGPVVVRILEKVALS